MRLTLFHLAGRPKLKWPEGLSDEELLRWWITSNGGYIHPALHLTKSLNCDGKYEDFPTMNHCLVTHLFRQSSRVLLSTGGNLHAGAGSVRRASAIRQSVRSP